VPKQNSFGAVYYLYEATWLRPDGTSIFATEDNKDTLTILFESAAYQQEREIERQNRPNPYTAR
jgi:hypothetical protein